MPLYGVAIREDGTLRLWLRVNRNIRGEIFIVWSVNHPARDAHSSRHADGRQHDKSYRRKMGTPTCRSRPDATFKGTEPLRGTVISARAAHALPLCDPREFTDVFVIEQGELDPEHHVVGVDIDLVQPGVTAPDKWGASLVRRTVWTDAVPHIVVSLWDMRSRKGHDDGTKC